MLLWNIKRFVKGLPYTATCGLVPLVHICQTCDLLCSFYQRAGILKFQSGVRGHRACVVYVCDLFRHLHVDTPWIGKSFLFTSMTWILACFIPPSSPVSTQIIAVFWANSKTLQFFIIVSNYPTPVAYKFPFPKLHWPLLFCWQLKKAQLVCYIISQSL